MEKRAIGALGLTASEVGLGCMSLTGAYGPADRGESIATVRRAIDLGVTIFDTADVYGPFTGERLLGEALAGRRDDVAIVTKFGGRELDDDGTVVGGVCGRPDYVRRSVDRSLRHLGTDRIDLLLQHRVDPAVPVEETFGAVGEMVTAGKIRYAGISEASAATVRRAHAAWPLSAVETEYSLFSRDVERTGVLAVVRELGIGFLAYAPLGRGLLSGAVRSADEVAGNLRAGFPRFEAGRLEHNIGLVEGLAPIAARLGLTTGQLALAWLLTAAPDVVAVPGTRRAAHLAENVAAAVRLDPETSRAVEAAVPASAASGGRTSPADADIQE
jgi:aryl-alcohol dehydrogenase-like predicted oxidoreductase